jgi:predicted phage terminase large subunit-like protein
MIRNPDLEAVFSGFGLQRNDKILRESEIMSKDMYAFAKAAWNIISVEPFEDNWHIGNICYHAQALAEGEIKCLLINMPFRSAKSFVFSKILPAWTWTNNPKETIITASHSLDLAKEAAVDSRRIIESSWYQERFCSEWGMSLDQNEKLKYKNTMNGERQAVSVDSGVTGKGGGLRMVDDPLDAGEAHSPAAKKAVIEWFVETFLSRAQNLNKMRTGIVAQRLAVDDLFGYIMETDPSYQPLILPNRFEKQYYIPSPLKVIRGDFKYEEPRTQDGELLFPARLNEEMTVKFERRRAFASAQLQQRPVPIGGMVWMTRWFGRYSYLPALRKRFIIADTAAKAGQHNDYSCFSLYGVTAEAHLYLIDVLKFKKEAVEQLKMLQIFHHKHKTFEPRHGEVPISAIYVEDKMTGIALIQEAKKITSLPIVPIKRKAISKMQRFDDTTTYLEAGLVYLPESAPWLKDIETEIESLTLNNTHANDDFCDTLSDAVYLTQIAPQLSPVGDLKRYRPSRPRRKSFA